uniref:Uncharacterized protein n=1 Tax=Triticum urartu TaxID=4572 RepID=A0A8R7QQR4_TRIUA
MDLAGSSSADGELPQRRLPAPRASRATQAMDPAPPCSPRDGSGRRRPTAQSR